jgi:Winged helix DNA-binding domain
VNTHSPRVFPGDRGGDVIINEYEKIERILEEAGNLFEFSSQRSAIILPLNDIKFDYACSAYNEYIICREVDDLFEFENFSHSPYWDIMLYLFMSKCINSSISVSSAFNEATFPITTGLRWLKALEDMGLLTRSDDPSDRCRAIVSITDKGWAKTCNALKLRSGK